jgi:hypothetical protein
MEISPENLSEYYNSKTNFKFQHMPKYHLFKNLGIIIDQLHCSSSLPAPPPNPTRKKERKKERMGGNFNSYKLFLGGGVREGRREMIKVTRESV